MSANQTHRPEEPAHPDPQAKALESAEAIRSARVRRRIWFVFLVIACGVVFAELYILFLESSGRPPIILRRSYERVQVGMTRDEVKEIMGADHGSIPKGRAMVGPGLGPNPGNSGSTWMGSDMVVQVWFSNAGKRVTSKEYRQVIATPEAKRDSLFTMLRRWMNL